MENGDKLDLRIQRTRLYIQKALFDLIREKGFDPITVNEIAERAMINRSTFYRHYQDKYDLAWTCLDATFRELLDELEEMSTGENNTNQTPMRNFLVLFRHIEENAELYRLLFGPDGISIFISRLREYIIQLLRFRMKEVPQSGKEGKMPIEMFEEYLAGAYLGVIQWWLDHIDEYPAEKVASWLYQMVVQGTPSALGIHI